MLNLQEVEERFFDGQDAIDCCGLIDLHFTKHPEPGSIFKFDPEFMQIFIDNLMSNDYVAKKFPNELRLIFNDVRYEDTISKLNIDRCDFFTTKEKNYFVLIIKR